MTERHERKHWKGPRALLGLCTIAALAALTLIPQSQKISAAEIQKALLEQQGQETVIPASVDSPDDVEIIDGPIVDENDDRFRSLAALMSYASNRQVGTMNHWTGNLFLTAAHEMRFTDGTRSPDSNYYIVANTYNLNAGGVTFPHIICEEHPQYDPSTQAFDIAVCQPNDGSDASWLPGTDIDNGPNTIAPPGTQVEVAGFGQNVDGEIAGSLLREAPNPMFIIPNARLRELSGNSDYIYPYHIGAGDASETNPTCAADSGYPGLVTHNGELVQVYVHSQRMGTHCASPGLPGIEVAINDPNIRNWLEAVQQEPAPATITPTASSTLAPSSTPRPSFTPVETIVAATATPTASPTETPGFYPTETATITPQPTPNDERESLDDCYQPHDDHITFTGTGDIVWPTDVFKNDKIFYGYTGCWLDPYRRPARPHVLGQPNNGYIGVSEAGMVTIYTSMFDQGECSTLSFEEEEQETDDIDSTSIEVCDGNLPDPTATWIPVPPTTATPDAANPPLHLPLVMN